MEETRWPLHSRFSPTADKQQANATTVLTFRPGLYPTHTRDSTTMAWLQFAERRSIVLLCYINFFLYVNRGIIPGAPESFQIFISKSLGVKVSQQNFYLGLLQSIYVASAAIFSLPFGYMAFTRKPFQLITWGLLSWVIGAVVCGLAHTADSYYVLAVGRVFMGAGEAAFQCNAIPFINRHAPKKNSTVWLGLCIASFTVGNALGYIYGSSFAESSLTWAAAFYVEGVLMLPAIACAMFCVPSDLNDVPEMTLGDMAGNLLEPSGPNKSLMQHWYGVFTNFPYTLVALGYGAYTFTMGCFATFTPTLLIGLGYYETEADVSIIFGVIVVLCGTIGTLAGGLALDKLTKGNTVPVARRCKLATDTLVVCVLGAAVSAIIMSQSTGSKTAVLIMLGVAFTFLAAVVPAENVAVMEMFPESRQPMAIAGNTSIMFIFGDVPSPMVLGWLKDTWAPECGSILIDGRPKLNPDCYKDRTGLYHVMLFATLWLLWAVALWIAAKFALRRKSEKRNATTVESPAFSH